MGPEASFVSQRFVQFFPGDFELSIAFAMPARSRYVLGDGAGDSEKNPW